MLRFRIIALILLAGQISYAQTPAPVKYDSIYVPCQIGDSFINSMKWGALALTFSAFGAYTAIGDDLNDGIAQGIVLTFYPSLIGSATFLGAFATDYILCSNGVKIRRRGKNNFGFIFGYTNGFGETEQNGTAFGLSYKFKNKEPYLPNLIELNFSRTGSIISLDGAKKKFQEKVLQLNLERLVHIRKALYTFYGLQTGYASGYYFKRLNDAPLKKIYAQNTIFSLQSGLGFKLNKNIMFKIYYRYFLKNPRSTGSGLKTATKISNHFLGYSLTFYML